MIRNQLTECRRLGVTIEYGVGAGRGLIAEQRPDHVIVATGAEPQRPWWVPDDADHVVDVREVLDGSASPAGDVVVIDEIGFHHATSVAELLADRGCNVEIVTNGMVVGQDLGITLDMENWWMRAGGQGHRPVDGPRADGDGRRARRGARSTCCTTRPGPTSRARPTGWCSPCRPTRSSGCTTSCKARRRQRRAGRRLRRPAPRPRRRRSKASAPAARFVRRFSPSDHVWHHRPSDPLWSWPHAAATTTA